MGVRYVVVVERLAPKAFAPRRVPAPAGVSATLGSQLDLEEVGVDPALLVYENTAWAPVRSVLPDGLELAEPGDDPVDDPVDNPVAEALSQAAVADLSDAAPALPDELGFTEFRGDVEAGQTIYQGTAPFGSWSLEVDGETAEKRPAFGFGSAFIVEEDGVATLTHDRSVGRIVLLLVQIVLWGFVLVRLARRRARVGGVT
jgi:hypothetical protein